MSAAVVLALAVVQLVSLAVLYLVFTQNGRLLLRIEAIEKSLTDQGLLLPTTADDVPGLPAGSVLTDFSLPALDGEAVSLSQFRGRPVLLVFLQPNCNFCAEFLEQVARTGFADGDQTPAIVFISQGEVETRQLFDRFPIRYPVLIETGGELSSLYQISVTPSGYLVDKDGRTASELLVGSRRLLDALKLQGQPARPGVTKSVAGSRLVRDGLKQGTTAPAFELPGLNGRHISLSDFKGERILLVFSDPQCQPCQELAPKLEQIHRTAKDLRVLMISRGDAGANQQKAAEHGLSFPIALQSHWEISRAYGMFATPIAYLIDEQGVLASDVAVGDEAILKLAAQPAVPSKGHTSVVG